MVPQKKSWLSQPGHQTALLGIGFAVLSIIEMFGAAFNRSQARALDASPQNQGVFSFGTMLNLSVDSLQVTVFLLFLLALQNRYQSRGGDLVNRALQAGIIISTAWRLMVNLFGNYTGFFVAGTGEDVLSKTFELIFYQQWFWTLGLTLLGLAWLMRAEKPLAGLTSAFGCLLLGGALFLAAYSELFGWADMARYIAMPIWASLLGGALLIQAEAKTP